MKKSKFHLNCDVGEGFDNEKEIFRYIDACNIACGGHAGNLNSMQSIVSLAKKHKIEIGAHPSYPDKENFGREILNISNEALKESIRMQIADLISVLNQYSLKLNHIKPHGALYNTACFDENIAQIILDVLLELPNTPKLYVPYKSLISKLALKHNIEVVFEAFADRNYNDDLSLVSRKKPEALITNPKLALEHIGRMKNKNLVRTITNKEVPIKADTFCIHSDTSSAITLIKKIADASI